MHKKIIAGGMLGLVSLLTAGQASAAEVVVQLSPSTQTANVGDTITLSIQGASFSNDAIAGNISLDWDASVLQLQSTGDEINSSLNANRWSRLDRAALVVDPATGQLDITAVRLDAVGPDFDFFSLSFTVLTGKRKSADVVVMAGPSEIGDWQDGSGQSITDITYTTYKPTKSKGKK